MIKQMALCFHVYTLYLQCIIFAMMCVRIRRYVVSPRYMQVLILVDSYSVCILFQAVDIMGSAVEYGLDGLRQVK